ncbi:MAG: lactate utilization protein C [Hyphomicrobiaceae bacterium]
MTGAGDASIRRDKILGGIRSRLGASGADARRTTVMKRLEGQRTHLVPERALQDAAHLRALFAAQLRAGSATVLEAASEAEIPGAVAGYLRGQNQPLILRVGDDPWLATVDWTREPALEVRKGRAEPSDAVGLSHAVAGIAETGTLMLASGPDNPVTITFLPETSIVILRASDLVGPYELAFDRIRERYGRGTMPRTLNFVSGASRTADVGGRLVMGAHGPRRFCVVIVG